MLQTPHFSTVEGKAKYFGLNGDRHSAI